MAEYEKQQIDEVKELFNKIVSNFWVLKNFVFFLYIFWKFFFSYIIKGKTALKLNEGCLIKNKERLKKSI
jgi:hypothetical protein